MATEFELRRSIPPPEGAELTPEQHIARRQFILSLVGIGLGTLAGVDLHFQSEKDKRMYTEAQKEVNEQGILPDQQALNTLWQIRQERALNISTYRNPDQIRQAEETEAQLKSYQTEVEKRYTGKRGTIGPILGKGRVVFEVVTAFSSLLTAQSLEEIPPQSEQK